MFCARIRQEMIAMFWSLVVLLGRGTSTPSSNSSDSVIIKSKGFSDILSNQRLSVSSFESDYRSLLEQIVASVNDIRLRQHLQEQERQVGKLLELQQIEELLKQQQSKKSQQDSVQNSIIDSLKQIYQLHVNSYAEQSEYHRLLRNQSTALSDGFKETELSMQQYSLQQMNAINSSYQKQLDDSMLLQATFERMKNKLEMLEDQFAQQNSKQQVRDSAADAILGNILNRVEQIQDVVRDVTAKQLQVQALESKVSDVTHRLQLKVTEGVEQLQQEHVNMLQKFIQLRHTSAISRILVQQHFDGTSFFNRTWDEFQVGFGDVDGNYWIGNERLHNLTKYGEYKLRVELLQKNDSLWYWAEYRTFKVGNESTAYRLDVSEHSGTAADRLTYHNGMKFSTRDRDNDNGIRHCALVVTRGNGGGFWYNDCAFTCINSPVEGECGFSWNGYGNKLLVSRLTLLNKFV